MSNTNTGFSPSTASTSLFVSTMQHVAAGEREHLLSLLGTLLNLWPNVSYDDRVVLVDAVLHMHPALTLSDTTEEETMARTLAMHDLTHHDDVDALVDYLADQPTPGVGEQGTCAGLPAGREAPLPPVADATLRNSPATPQRGTPGRGEVRVHTWHWLRGYLAARIRSSRKGRTVSLSSSYSLKWWMQTCAISGIKAKCLAGPKPRLQVLDRDGSTWLEAELSA